MTLKLITEPAAEPVTLDELKAQCRVDGTDEDALLTALIVAARQQCEQELGGRSLITQTWERSIDAFPCSEIELGMGPLQAVGPITYADVDGAQQTLDSAAYVGDTTQEPGWALPADGYEWPATLDTAGAVKVRFTAGFGDAASDVPQAIRQWILLRASTLYKFRESVAAGVSVTELPGRYIDSLIDRWRVY